MEIDIALLVFAVFNMAVSFTHFTTEQDKRTAWFSATLGWLTVAVLALGNIV